MLKDLVHLTKILYYFTCYKTKCGMWVMATTLAIDKRGMFYQFEKPLYGVCWKSLVLLQRK